MSDPAQGERNLLIALGFGLFSGSIGVYFVPVQIGALIDGLSLNESTAGLMGAVEIACMSLTAIVISPRLIHWSKSRTATVGVILAATAQALTSLIDVTLLLFLLRLLTGIGCGCVFASVCVSAALTSIPDRSFAWAQAIMNALFFIMFLLAPFALSYSHHRGLFVLLALVLVSGIPLYRHLEISGNSAETQQQKHKRAGNILIGMHIVATILLNIGLGALWAFVERMGSVNIGLDAATIGTVLSSATLFMIAGSLFAAWLGVRIGRTIPLAVASILCGCAALLVSSSSSLLFYALGLFIYNFAYLFIGPYIIAGSSAALDSSGRLAAAMGGIMFLSYSAGVGTGGYVVEFISLKGIGVFALFTCFIAAPLFMLVSQTLERNDGH